jgi:hypothetical protein
MADCSARRCAATRSNWHCNLGATAYPGELGIVAVAGTVVVAVEIGSTFGFDWREIGEAGPNSEAP